MLKSIKRLLSLLPLYLMVVSCNVATTPQALPGSFPTSEATETGTASSAAGNVIVYFSAGASGTSTINAAFFPPGATTPTALPQVTLTDFDAANGVFSVGLDDAGNILVGFANNGGVTFSPNVYYYNASTHTWSNVTLTGHPTYITDISVALNPSGQGVVTFVGGPTNVAANGYAYKFTEPGTLTQIIGPVTVTSGSELPQASVNAEGIAAVGFDKSASATTVSTYLYDLNNDTQLATTTYSGNYQDDLQILALPGSQGAMTLYENTSTGVSYAILTASTAPAVAPAVTAVINDFTAAVDPSSGNVLLAYSSATTNGELFSEVYANAAWSAPNQLSTAANGDQGGFVVVATSGVGAIAWANLNNTQISGVVFDSLREGVNTPSTPPGVLNTTTPVGFNLPLVASAAVNPSSSPFSAGILSFVGTNNQVYYSLLNIATGSGGGSPTNLKAKKIKDKFLTQTDLIASLTWGAPTTGTAVSYNIIKNGVVVANVPASQLSYKLHGLKYNRTYTIGVSAVSSTGTVSTPATVTVRFSSKK